MECNHSKIFRDVAVWKKMRHLLTEILNPERWEQCDQIKIAKYLLKLPKNDFTTKVIDFNTFTKIA